MIPYLAFYSDDVPSNMAGKANGPIISIHTRFKGDKGTLMHEREHVKQWWFWVLLSGIAAAWLFYTGEPYWFFAFLPGIGAHSLLYAMVAPYRQWCEVQAYKVQASYGSPDALPFYANALVVMYNLDITHEKALKLLSN
jgi:hypothetical protein